MLAALMHQKHVYGPQLLVHSSYKLLHMPPQTAYFMSVIHTRSEIQRTEKKIDKKTVLNNSSLARGTLNGAHASTRVKQSPLVAIKQTPGRTSKKGMTPLREPNRGDGILSTYQAEECL